jgi:hypothetical protein
MRRYRAVWSAVLDKDCGYGTLNVAQLVKHAFALRTQVHRQLDKGRRATLYYLYADPVCWPDGRHVDPDSKSKHWAEIERFAGEVNGDEVDFVACSYRSLLTQWQQADFESLRQHAMALGEWAHLN